MDVFMRQHMRMNSLNFNQGGFTTTAVRHESESVENQPAWS